MNNLHNEAIKERIDIINQFSSVKTLSRNWTDQNGNLKKNTYSEELLYLVGFSILFNLISIPKVLVLIYVGNTFWERFGQVKAIDLLICSFLLSYFQIVEFRCLLLHQRNIKSSISKSSPKLYDLNDELNKISKKTWKGLLLLIPLILLTIYGEISGTFEGYSIYLILLSPIIIVVIFVSCFKRFQSILENIRRFEEFLRIEEA